MRVLNKTLQGKPRLPIIISLEKDPQWSVYRSLIGGRYAVETERHWTCAFTAAAIKKIHRIARLELAKGLTDLSRRFICSPMEERIT